MEGSNPSLEWDELELKISQVCFSMHCIWEGGWGCVRKVMWVMWGMLRLCVQACVCEEQIC